MISVTLTITGPEEDFTKYTKLAFWAIIVFRVVVVMIGLLGLWNFFSPIEGEEIKLYLEKALCIQLGIFLFIVIIAHLSVKNQDLRLEFAFLGCLALYFGIGMYMVIAGYLGVLLLIHSADIIDYLLGKDLG